MKRIPKSVILVALSMGAVLYSCSVDEREINDLKKVEVNGRELPAEAFEQGKVRLLLTEGCSLRQTAPACC